jgi:tRNA(Arg) A34 adenosine deaminase TadA
MRAAIEIAERHQTPFGAALAMGDQLFVTAANQTGELNDPTAHAEVMAIRKLGEQIKKTNLSGFTLYTTCEPCPMCMSAAIWAKVDALFYGCDIPTITQFLGQIQQRASRLSKNSIKLVPVAGDILEPECRKLLTAFA